MSARAGIRLTLGVLVLALVSAGPAAAQVLPPSLTVDTNYAFSGVARYDFTVTAGISVDTANGAAIDQALDRHYAVGEAATADADLAVVARRANGAPDTSFAGDGALALAITPGARDLGTAIVVLPDHRLRIAGATDVSTTATPDLDAVVVGLLPDGSLDPAFGPGGADGDGIVTFTAPGDQQPTRMALDGAGRLALTGGTDADTFIAVLESGGTPAAFGAGGVAMLDGGSGSDDRGVDVAWGAGGPVVLVQASPGPGARSASLHAFTATGDDDGAFSGDGDLPLDPGGTDIVAGGLVAYGGSYWITGSSAVAGDTDAYLARVKADGTGAQARRFDMRGSVFPAAQQVASEGLDLAIAPGEPDTLVVAGSVITDRGSEWGTAAFNGLGGSLAALATGDLVIPIGGQGAAVDLAAGLGGVLAVSGSLIDYSVETDSGSEDPSIGMARLLVDAEKRCDLALAVVAPLELVLSGARPASVTLEARNTGQRTCGGAISVPGPYVLTPALQTGKLAPGASVTLQAQLSYPARFPVSDTLELTLVAAGDASPGDNVASLRVVFSFCDLRLVLTGSYKVLGTEGARRYDFSVRNVGTTACRNTRIAVGGVGRRSGTAEAYTVPAGQSVTDELDAGVRKGTLPGRRAALVFTASDPEELQPGDNSVTSSPLVVRPGDTNARRPIAGRRFSGTAKDGRGTGVRKRTLKLTRVEIAVRRRGKGCRWLSGPGGALRTVPAGAKGACDVPVWVKARGTRQWKLNLRKAVPKGKYVLLTRAVTANGVAEGAFKSSDRNSLRFTVR